MARQGLTGRDVDDRFAHRQEAYSAGWGSGPERTGAGLPEAGHRGRGPRGYRRSDQRIWEEICERLADDRRIDASDIEVTVQDGEATLRGEVNDRGSRRLAEDLAEQVSGVTFVQNDLRVRPQGTMGMVGGYGTPVAAAYGLDASPSADPPVKAPAAPAATTTSATAVGPAATAAAATGAERSTEAHQAGAGVQPAARTITAMFATLADAERAADALARLGLGREAVSIIRDEQGAAASGEAPGEPQEERGFFAALKSLFLPEQDRETYEAGIRRGGALLTARVPEARASEAIRQLQDAGAIDLEAARGGRAEAADATAGTSPPSGT
jgi:hypothetical protein